MRGALAAGHPLTAQAGADVLLSGGNAVDACIAAAAVSWVCESPLTGPGGGGFLLVHHAEQARTQLLDFFVAFPEQAGSPDELIGVLVDYGDSQQTFYTGPASVAVPGIVLGLGEAHARWGSMPWAELLGPGVRVARAGVLLNEEQAFLHRILDGLLRYSPEGDALYGPGRALELGERLLMPELADTLEQIGAEGAESLYRGELAERIAAHVPITLEDLARYEVIEREPLEASFRGEELRTTPPPSDGGRLVVAGLEALVACAGVTLRSVATSMELDVTGSVHAEGDLDFRGTLGVDRDASVGFTEIRLRFDLVSNDPEEKLDKLLELTERYCVVGQTLAGGVPVDFSYSTS